LPESRVDKRVQDPGSVFNMGAKYSGGVAGKMGYIYSTSCDFLDQLVLLVKEHKTAQLSSCRPTRNLINEEPRNGIQYSQ
jgi:hypothetical protein